ncbi:MAG: hypothetical protein JRH13_01095 [Deltaproteobacteria bacterium]|nr:hypothetical protein [Deltaproteobacteria bacterium]MBW2016938.1 hypothetical protein [Deltaproteobacteria bacterium]MBW2127943.1 hypothetical protein [Deltaproteobacteria bacterium]MBW2303207.1 hypothetical protein [Deltaproteobacteria bacterium]
MKKAVLQLIILLVLAALVIGGYVFAGRILSLPFRAVNDTLHERDSAIKLDFLIPGGTYIDEQMTIREVIQARFKKQVPLVERAFKGILSTIPPRYRYLFSLLFFLFFTFSFMAFFRVFTFVGYGRALRISLLFAGILYFFLPDLIPKRIDDILFLGVPLLIILLRLYFLQKGKRRKYLRG